MSEPESDRLDGAPHPRETATLYGQATAQAQFLATLGAGRPHHGWMLVGPRGVGKATLAWRIARHMLAGGIGDTLAMDPADPVFRQTTALASPRLFLGRRSWDDKAKRMRSAIAIDEIRALKGFFQFSATDAGWRVAIIDAADDLTPQAANALLKTLEEPPARAMILLVCHQPARLLPTIRSRCRELRCAPLGPSDLAAALTDAGAAAPADPALLDALAAGSVGEALRLAAVDGPNLYAEIAELLATAPGLDRRRAIAIAESCTGRGAESRYDATLALIRFALVRLARCAAGAPVTALTEPEGRALARLGAAPAQASLWANLAPRLGTRSDHARAVHLDPASVILDTFLQIDAAAAEARAFAA